MLKLPNVTLTLSFGCNPATSSVHAFQHASSNEIHDQMNNSLATVYGM